MSDEDLMTFLGEEEPKQPSPATVEPSAPEVWRVLITDDEQDVHSATAFALRNTKIMGRRLEFLHAKSAEEALTILKENDDIAVILLDVVMETPNAGLDLVAVIREELGNSQSRIILRTGQPNQAPEIEVIRDYDINDYKLKSELTQNKLYASLTTAVRSYQQIRTIESSKQGLDLIVRGSSDLMSKRGLTDFATGVIVQLAGLLSIKPEGLICVRRDEKERAEPFIIAAAGHYCELIDRPLSEMTEAEERDMLAESLNTASNIYGEHGVALYLGSTERGDMSCYVGSTMAMRQVDKGLLELFCSNISICADNVELVDRLRSFAFTDALVQLPNRNAFNESVGQLLTRPDAADYSLALVDIDNFAEINAALGQQYCDQLLVAIAERLKDAFPPPAIVARIAGDTFALLAKTEALAAEHVHAPFKEYFEVEDEHQLVSITCGIVALADIGNDKDDVLKSAGVVLKLAKNQHRGEVLHYHSDMLKHARERLGVLRNLRDAFESGALFLVFQPKFDLANNGISGFEALLRWRDEGGNIIYPDTFIQIAEQSGLIVRMGEWILRKAVDALHDLHQRGWEGSHVSVNVSAAQLRHPDFLNMLARIAEESPVPTNCIDLEITESMGIADSEMALTRLNEIKNLGFTLSIDDFGTGFSSLSYLQKMPIDRLKIDQSFVHTSGEESGREIIEMIIQLGNTLDLRVIAEGVENSSELDLLKQLKCDEIQGFLYAKPMGIDDLHGWLDDNAAAYKK